MIFVTLAALAGRVVLSILSEKIGRRASGVLCGGGAVVMLLIAAFFGETLASVATLFLLVLMIAYFFGEGGFSIVGPYSPRSGRRRCGRPAWVPRTASVASARSSGPSGSR